MNYTILHLHTDLSTATTNIDSVTKSEDYETIFIFNGSVLYGYLERICARR